MSEIKIGQVIHWYDKAGVAVIKLSHHLGVGEVIKVRRNEAEFEAPVDSMQINHQNISAGEAGEEVAVKLPEAAREGALVYLVV